jgi:hypothetical protein
MMDDFQQPPPGSIRITHDEAMSSHVDDLLQRQRSLRGQSPLARQQRSRWYYQSWFVQMLVAGAAAFAAWAILEPYFDDFQYIQGTVGQLNPNDVPGQIPLGGGQFIEFELPTRGSLLLKGERIWLLSELREVQPDGTITRFDPGRLRQGQEVGLYVEYAAIGSGGIAFAHYVVLDPPPQSPEQAAMSLGHLATRTAAAGLLMFAVVGGLIGLAIGAADGTVCRLLRRALLAGGIGLLVGFIGGFVSGIIANLVYAPLNQLAMGQSEGVNDLSPFGFAVQMVGRGLAWLLAGMTMGLGQGIALRSKRLILYGLLGGIVGGLIGGLLFDPIDLLLLGGDRVSAHWSRLIGFTVVGMCVGAMIGVVELLARDAWLRMAEGPLAGKEFLLFKDTMQVGSSPRADIYLFNDPEVAGFHATIRSVGDHYEIENTSKEFPAEVNGRRFQHTRLRHGDRIAIGDTVFVYQQRKG